MMKVSKPSQNRVLREVWYNTYLNLSSFNLSKKRVSFFSSKHETIFFGYDYNN